MMESTDVWPCSKCNSTIQPWVLAFLTITPSWQLLQQPSSRQRPKHQHAWVQCTPRLGEHVKDMMLRFFGRAHRQFIEEASLFFEASLFLPTDEVSLPGLQIRQKCLLRFFYGTYICQTLPHRGVSGLSVEPALFRTSCTNDQQTRHSCKSDIYTADTANIRSQEHACTLGGCASSSPPSSSLSAGLSKALSCSSLGSGFVASLSLDGSCSENFALQT